MKLERIVEGLFLGPTTTRSASNAPTSWSRSPPRRSQAAARRAATWRRSFRDSPATPATGELDGVGIKRFPEAVPRPRSTTGCSDRHRLDGWAATRLAPSKEQSASW